MNNQTQEEINYLKKLNMLYLLYETKPNNFIYLNIF